MTTFLTTFLSPMLSKLAFKPRVDHFLLVPGHPLGTPFGGWKYPYFPVFGCLAMTRPYWFSPPSGPITLKWTKMAKMGDFHGNSWNIVQNGRKEGPKTVNSGPFLPKSPYGERRFKFLLSEQFWHPGKSLKITEFHHFLYFSAFSRFIRQGVPCLAHSFTRGCQKCVTAPRPAGRRPHFTGFIDKLMTKTGIYGFYGFIPKTTNSGFYASKPSGFSGQIMKTQQFEINAMWHRNSPCFEKKIHISI